MCGLAGDGDAAGGRAQHGGVGHDPRPGQFGAVSELCGLGESAKRARTSGFGREFGSGFWREVPQSRVEWAAIMPPTLSNGKICYLEIPARDVARSADFYQKVFDWNMRQRGDGATAFDDAVGEVSGAFVLGRPPASAPGLMIYIWVESATATVEAIVANGGEIVQAIGGDAPEITARFRDPGGNVMGIYQEPV